MLVAAIDLSLLSDPPSPTSLTFCRFLSFSLPHPYHSFPSLSNLPLYTISLSPWSLTTFLSWMKPRNGASPVPGPTMITGQLGRNGRRRLECRMNIGTRTSGTPVNNWKCMHTWDGYKLDCVETLEFAGLVDIHQKCKCTGFWQQI